MLNSQAAKQIKSKGKLTQIEDIRLQTGCLCFGLRAPHQCSADAGADTWQNASFTLATLHNRPGWLKPDCSSRVYISNRIDYGACCTYLFIPKAIGNRKGDCGLSCSRWQTQPEKICKSAQISVIRSAHCTDLCWFADFLRLCLSPRTSSRTISFSISNSVWC